MEVRRREIDKGTVPIGALLLENLGIFRFRKRKCYQVYVLVLTFLVYTSYHMSRKPFSVVAKVLAPGCRHVNSSENKCADNSSNITEGWVPFNGEDCKTLIGAVDYAWLFTYAVFLVGSGVLADRMRLRYFLTGGMIGSGIFVGLLGVAYFAKIHTLEHFIIVQIGVGVFESTGWPGTVAVMGNWFGKKNRGLVLGVWNAHTSVGNILGTIVPAQFAKNQDSHWGWAFLVPAFVMIFMGAVVFLFLVTDPTHVGLKPPKHHLDKKTHSGLSNAINEQRHVNRYLEGDRNSLKRKEEKEEEEEEEEEKEDDRDVMEGADNKVASINATNESGKNDDHDNDDEQMAMRKKAVDLLTALKVPGVIEYSMALFFTKLVSYTFLFWLPFYIANNPINHTCLSNSQSDLLSTLFDVGGIAGSISTGLISDLLGARAISCVLMMYLAVPTLFLYRSTGLFSYALSAVLISLCGLFINGPYALITTAISNDLGTDKALKKNQKAKATVGGIIDATGSLGAACGPFITGIISQHFGWSNVFYVLMGSCFLSSLMLSRVLYKEIRDFYRRRRSLICYKILCWHNSQ